MYPPEWLPSLARRDIDCFFGHEPFLTQLPSIVPDGHVLHRNGQDDVYILQNLLAFNASWVKQDPEAATAAFRGMIDTMQWVNDNREEAARIAAKAFQMDASTLLKLMECCTYKIDFPQQLEDAVREISSWAFNDKKITVAPDQLIPRLLYPGLIKSVAPDRCTASACSR
jgi:ABC-type nitrate/sulfonate/bicarbonate transport system substrate-binding protein